MYVWQCGAAVKELLLQMNQVRLPATPHFLFLCIVFFFFCLVFVFSPIFPFGLFFFIRTADPPYHALESIYILSFSPELHFREGTKLVHHSLF